MNSGDILGHYRILEPLGKGGMGEVYAADDTKLHRRVALKLLPALFAADPERRKRFEREAHAVAALNHPGIVTIHSVEIDGPVPFLTMELVEGGSLRQAIPGGGMPTEAVLRIGVAISDAVAAAHQRGIVHRDLKPANVMVGPDGRVKVLDFGLAKLREAEAAAAGETSTTVLNEDLSGEGRIVGTVAYMSPEQAEGKPVDHRSDIFSLGVMLHEMATGERPFKGDTEISIISSIIKDTPGAITDTRPDLPLPLARIVKRCLVKDPQRRYQSARDLQTDLEDLKQDVDSGVRSTPGTTAVGMAAARGRVPRKTMYVSVGVTVLLAAIAIGWFTPGLRRGRPHLFEPEKFTRLTDSGTAFLAALSPDGRYVAHAKLEKRLAGLWVRQTGAASDVRVVPPSEARIDGVVFSPDGNYVFYNAYPRQSGVATLYKVPVLGGASVRVLEDVDSAVSFSPDGSQLSFMRGRPAENVIALIIANADGTGAKQLAAAVAPSRLDAERAAWSPDGRTLVATARSVTDGVFRARLAAVDVPSGRITDFGGDWNYIRGVDWMPDGRSVIISAADAINPQAQLWQVTWPDGERRRITSGVNGYGGASVAADGRTIATVEGEGHSNIWVFPVDGGPGRRITSAARSNAGGPGMAWLPDGRLIYGASVGGGENQLWVMDGDGGNATQLTSAKGFAALPAISPDGRTVYYNGGDNRSAMLKMSLDGGEPAQMSPGPSDFRAVVSPDGKWVYYTSGGEGRNRAMKVSADSGSPVPLTAPEMLFSATAISPDGSRLFGSAWNAPKRRSQPATASTQDGAIEFIDGAPPGATWMPDGKTWLYADLRNGAAVLFLKPIGTGAEREIANLGEDQAWRVAPSPDGRLLAVVRGRSTNDVVLIKSK